MCPRAPEALRAPVAVLLSGGGFRGAHPAQPTTWCCPDPTDMVVFRLVREE